MTSFTDKPLDRHFTVEVRGTSFDVVLPDGRRCDGLCWDEMLGQVARLTHPKLVSETGYAMRTPEQWDTHWENMCNKANQFLEIKE
ncbi:MULTISPECIES: hypothetical protein [unclassified Cupriavidus]|uniref:hypothetical protein n=1 Tax=unclassified Cupriavidus TaxID=2640874 RepID=UPI000E9A96D4|nr:MULTISPECIES: hypothetical protein [unclassified Cupriavidus]HBD37097.1 hypothetical protein [Cupriavidus sp.]HBO83092.1 hypothetical protein [Cupriavidus sp.]